MRNKEKYKTYRPFVFFALFLFIFHLSATAKFSDDVIFMSTNPLQHGLIPLIMDAYHNWTSRVLIYPTMIAFCNAPIFAWRILELSAWITLVVSISKMVIREENESGNWFLVGFVMIYPYWHMATAGWIATTTNFTWPLALGAFALLTLKRIREGVKVSIFRYVLYVIALLYASDAEQGVMLLAIIFVVLTAVLYYSHRASSVQYRITLLGSLFYLTLRLMFTLTSPGNSVRALAGHWLVPEYAEYSLFQRILLGFELTAMHYTQFTVFLFPFFSIFLAIIVWHRHKAVYKRLIAAIPLAISAVLSILTAVNAIQYMRDNLANSDGQFINGFLMTAIPRWAGSNLLFLLFFACLLYTLYLSCAERTERIFTIGVMLLGFFSQLVLGLSPSLYGSALRTFIYASFSIIVCAVYLYDRGARMYMGKSTKLLFSVACMANITITFVISLVRMRY